MGLKVAQVVQNIADLGRQVAESYRTIHVDPGRFDAGRSRRRGRLGVERQATDDREPERGAPAIPLAHRRRAQIAGCLFGGAVFLAPFLALLYDLTAGLAVMALALGALTVAAYDAAAQADPPKRRQLLTAAALNGMLALLCLLVTVIRLS